MLHHRLYVSESRVGLIQIKPIKFAEIFRLVPLFSLIPSGYAHSSDSLLGWHYCDLGIGPEVCVLMEHPLDDLRTIRLSRVGLSTGK